MEKAEKKAASIEAEHVSQLTCAGCQKVLDVSHLPSFSQIKCPECGTEQIVPAKFGSFLLIKQLGAGGMGVIYRAMDRELGRKVALKVMKRSLGDNPEFVQGFKHEAQAAAALNHRNVVQIYSFGQYNGQPYIVMELVDGGKLDDMIAAPGGIDELRALEITLEATEGLKAASDVGLVHGDVKPANILFGKSGEAKVVDFGLASYIGEQQAGGPVWGTPFYIAPEKARGKKVDFRSDIYSLGATLFHVLTAKPPFDGPTSNDVVMARLNQPAPNILDINPNLHKETASLIARMLEVDPAMRYPSYPALLIDMRNALKAARKPMPKAKIPISIPMRTRETKIKLFLKKINLKIAGLAAGGVLVIALLIAGWMWNNRQQELKKRQAAERLMLEKSREEGKAAFGRIINIAALIADAGTNVSPLAERADKIAVSVSRVDDHTAKAMDETDKAAECLNETEDLLAIAYTLACQSQAVTNYPVIKRLTGEIDGVHAKMILIYGSIQEHCELAREVLVEAAKSQSTALGEIGRARAEKARAEAEQRKREAEKLAAKKKADELAKMKPKLIQQDLDLIEKCRGANALMISKRRFAEAERSFALVKPRLALEESLAVYNNVVETYNEIARLKSWMIDSINAAPFKKGWVIGASGRDIVKADNEAGLTIALGAAGTTFIPWEAVTLPHMLAIINHYAESTRLSDPQKALIWKQAALLCYESGVFKNAETYANKACKASPDILADLNRLMPEIATPE